MDDLQNTINIAQEGKRIIDSEPFKKAMSRLDDHLDMQLFSCDPDNKEKAQRVVLAKQIFKGIHREFERLLQEGEVAKIQLDELNAKKVTEFRR